jgi:hypothetical protein
MSQTFSPGVDGDFRSATTEHYISLSSSSRDKNTFTSSDDCEVIFNELNNVTELQLVNFEIPHTRYAIDKTNNTFYLSEKVSEGVYNFFGLKAGTGGYTIQNLAVTLELSQKCPTVYTAGTVLKNSYNFLTATRFGKVAVVSSGDVEYNIHVCKETLFLKELSKTSDTRATITFLAPFEYILSPGSLLTLKMHNMVDREVQVVATPGPRTVTVIGDFGTDSFSFDQSEMSVEKSYMIPYSSQNPVAEVAGFGVVDLDMSKNAKFEVLGLQSPFAFTSSEMVPSPMVVVDFPIFVSTGDNVVLSGVAGVAKDVNAFVGTTHDDTHFQIDLDVSKLLTGNSIAVFSSAQSLTHEVASVTLEGYSENTLSASVATVARTSILPGDTLTLSGMSSPEWKEGIISQVLVDSVDEETNTLFVTFKYPTELSFEAGSTYVAPTNSLTGIPTTYLSPNRFDLSRGRRVILCRATIDGKDLGTTLIPNNQTVFFGRVQLLSGADLVNFLSVNQAVGGHKFKSMVKRLRAIRFRFYNEDGSQYKFIGVDYTLFLKVVCFDSNTGI